MIIVSDPENKIVGDFAGWVLQIAEDESVATTPERIAKAAHDYNRSRKGRLYPAKTAGETLENVPAKHFREVGCWVKTRTPILVIRTNNEIPKEQAVE